MAKVLIRSIAEAEADRTHCISRGTIETLPYFGGQDHSLHLHVYRLSEFAVLRLAAKGTDYALFVWRGTVEAGGRQLTSGSSLIIERGAVLDVASTGESSEILAFAARPDSDKDLPTASGEVRVLPSARVPRYGGTFGGDSVGGALHADATSADCSIWLHENIVPAPRMGMDGEVLVHSHTVDEIIVVTRGQLRFGSRHLGPGGALAIAANAFYSFTPGPDGLSFVNFRAERPGELRFKKGGGLDEAGYWRENAGSPQPISIGISDRLMSVDGDRLHIPTLSQTGDLIQ